jgi:integrase
MKGCVINRGPNTWALKIDIGKDPVTGKRRSRWHTVHGGIRKAQGKLTELLGTVQDGAYVDRSDSTLEAFLENWLTGFMVRQVAPTTYERYCDLLRLHVIPHIGHLRLQDVTATAIDTLYTKLLIEGRHQKKAGGLAPRTVHHVHRVVKMALKKAAKNNLTKGNPADDATPPKVEEAEIECLEWADVKRLLAFLETGPDGKPRPMYLPSLIAATTGMRRGEVLALRWGDIDFGRNDFGQLTVAQSLEQTKAGLRFKSPKSKGSRRTITLPDLTVAALRRHKAEQAALRLQLGLGKDERDLVITTPEGEPRSPRSLTQEFDRVLKVAKVGRTTFHGLRHAHATDLLRRGVNVKVVSERLGHAGIGITLAIYHHVMPNMQAEVVAILNRALTTDA